MDAEVAEITSDSPVSATVSSDSPVSTAVQNSEQTDVSPVDKVVSETTEVIEENTTESGDGEICEEDEPLECGLDRIVNEEHVCVICEEKFKQPRILQCLHVFCTPCLEKQAAGEDDSEESKKKVENIECNVCKQITPLTGKGIEDLPLDTVMSKILDMSAMDDPQIVCTSCKAREKAVARCNDCASFLCPNCVTAHQYMRCFENHKVVSFEDLQNGEGVDLTKPMFCSVHNTENLKYFCNTCQILVCNECVVGEHKQPVHHYERISDLEDEQKTELKTIVEECKGKVQFCEYATSTLESALTDLEMQRDDARGQIEETFQTYRTMLEARKDALLKDLDEMHTAQELDVMEMFHNVEKTIEKIEDGTKFTERILEHGSGAEILSMKKMVTMQLLSLINNTPKPDVNIKINFQTDQDKFKEAITEAFGSLTKCDDDQKNVSVTSLETDGFPVGSGTLTTDGQLAMPSASGSNYGPEMQTLPPLSIPGVVSLPSMTSVPVDPVNSIASSIQANLPSERSSSRNSYSPAMSDSGISMDAGSTSSNNSGLVNLNALAKLGTITVNVQGQICLNGQIVPGLNVNNVQGLPQATTKTSSRGPTPTPTSHADNTLTSLLNSIGGNQSPVPTAAPQISDISGLLPSSGNMTGSRLSRETSGSASNLLGQVGQYVPQQPDPSDPLLSDPLDSSGEGGRGLTEIANLLTQTSAQLVNGLSRSSSSSPATVLPIGVPIHGSMGGLNMATPPPTTPSYSPNSMNLPFPTRASGKMSAMQIRCKFGQLGPGKGQFNSPHGFCLGLDEDIVVADTNNHRIQIFEKTGEFKYQFGIPGREEGQLWYPRKVAVMRHSGKYVVCDRGNERSRMQIFTKNGHFIKKIAIRYIDIVAGLAITTQGHIVAVDSVSPTVFCIAETGDLIKWFDCSDYMREPSDIAVNSKEYFVCDFKGHCVVVFSEEGQFLRRIGCENITNFPNGIDISDAGDVLVGDSHGNRFHVAVFQRDGSLIGEFECPYVKVSRCCGLKITSEGYVVTLAKNNHHVLVLNTLYIT